jgi:bifunctional non-homologous end joining protein LigD
MRMAKDAGKVTIDGRAIRLSNLDKVLYPAGKFTKANVIDYYIRISDYLLPHLKDRPVTLKRFPNGIFGEFFYEKDAPAFTPEWVSTFPVPRRAGDGPPIRYIQINDLSTLVWLANVANLEIHPFLHRAPDISKPTSIVFDCDPGEGAEILTCARVALLLHDVLADLRLEACAKVSGSKGIQVYVPLNSEITYETTQNVAKAIATFLAMKEPKLVVSEMSKRLRTKKVFIDWSQNSDFKTTVAVYSLRANSHHPYVSVPVEWDELKSAIQRQDGASLYFEPEDVLKRVRERCDLFEKVLTMVQALPPELTQHLSNQATRRQQGRASHSESMDVRSSRQGSRRRFLLSKSSKANLRIQLEIDRGFKTWQVSKGMPQRKGEIREVTLVNDAEKIRHNVASNTADIGTYELLEGAYKNGFLRFYLNGEKLKGEWTLEREAKSLWQLEKTSESWAGRRKHG